MLIIVYAFVGGDTRPTKQGPNAQNLRSQSDFMLE